MLVYHLFKKVAYNTKDTLIANKKRQLCIWEGARMKNACSGLRSRLEAVLAVEGYFFFNKWYLHILIMIYRL